MALLNDVFLAVVSNGRVQIWELNPVIRQWNLLDYLPPPPAVGHANPAAVKRSQSVHWLDEREVLVSYENVAVIRYQIQNFNPLQANIIGANAMDGIITDVCFITKSILISSRLSNTYGLYTYAEALSLRLLGTFTPRSHVLNRALLAYEAVFCMVDTVLGSSSGRIFLWDLAGSRIATLLLPIADQATLVRTVTCKYDYASQCGRLATATENCITLWITSEEQEETTTVDESNASEDDGSGPAPEQLDGKPDMPFNYSKLCHLSVVAVAIFGYVYVKLYC
ncbi:hypothetical protein VKT23_019166 [Stygiomarasmius scandens]|uniref:Uncharacterized protein n=1 Tax=Marasmiellus scandens TaxID=2682957 RepID=A0ABR1IRI4_9AGAR